MDAKCFLRFLICCFICLALPVSATYGYERTIGFEEAIGTSAGGSGDRLPIAKGLVIDNTEVHSGAASARGDWVEGECCTVGGYIEDIQPKLTERDEIWYRGYFYFQPGWSWDCSPVVKFMRFARDVDGSNAGLLSIFETKDGFPRLDNEGESTTETHNVWQRIGTPISLDSEEWYAVEFYAKFGRNDTGKAAMWIDGELKLYLEDYPTMHLDNETMGRLTLMAYWNGNAPQNQTQWIDDICVSTTRHCGVMEIDITSPSPGLDYTSSGNSVSLAGTIREDLLPNFISSGNPIHWKQEKREHTTDSYGLTVVNLTPIAEGVADRTGSTWTTNPVPLVDGNNYFSVWVYDGDEANPDTKKWTDTINIYYEGGGISDTSAPSVPQNVTATAVSSSQINLSWDASTDNVGVTGYRVTRDGVQIGAATSTTYQDLGLSPSTSYTYQVSAYDAAGNESALSNSVIVATLDFDEFLDTECEDWQTRHPEWIFCDDFESGDSLVGQGRYFEYDSDGGDFAPVSGVGLGGSTGMRTIWQTGEVGAGSLKLAFGRNPSANMDKGIRATEDFRDIYYRMYVKMQDGWEGNPAKLSRATVIAAEDWSQAMIAHLWGNGEDKLLVDPVRCVDKDSNVKCIGYNDFGHMDWLGGQAGLTPIFSPPYDGQWHCIEVHVRLNDPGLSNGVEEFWIDGKLEARRDGLNFVRSYTDYAINAIFFENYWNEGSPRLQERYFDNFVVSTQPIGPAVPLSDTEPPTGSVQITDSQGNPLSRTGSENVTLTLTATDNASGVTEMQLSDDGTTWPYSAVSYQTSLSWDLKPDVPEGVEEERQVWVKFKDGADNWSSPVSDSIIVDKDPPIAPTGEAPAWN